MASGARKWSFSYYSSQETKGPSTLPITANLWWLLVLAQAPMAKKLVDQLSSPYSSVTKC